MTLTEAKIYVPTEMLPWIDNDDFVPTVERNAMLLYPYIKNLTISHGKAADILGIRKNDLIDIYAKMGIPYFDCDEDELDEEVAYYHTLRGAGI